MKKRYHMVLNSVEHEELKSFCNEHKLPLECSGYGKNWYCQMELTDEEAEFVEREFCMEDEIEDEFHILTEEEIEKAVAERKAELQENGCFGYALDGAVDQYRKQLYENNFINR